MARHLGTAATLLVAIAASVAIFAAVDAGWHSVSDTLYGVVVSIAGIWLAALAVLAIVRRTMASR